ncbi:DNA double-strand break repair Rad50 ATPase [hydrothermal vent metagenome]|uniref:DNA double-strand break repair Rad50 ATPase n=1 Tax=hydrothermal vent metagenome TaxID=652676 RepID=A0A1W1BWS5_9ZZZZ
MKLLQLTSSDDRFQTLNFKSGLNIIVGQKVLTDDKKKTSNGIGKSLALICIDFMLGKSTSSKEIKKLKEVMKRENITLSLAFEHNNKTYNIDRTYNEIFIDGEKLPKESKYLEFLDSLVESEHSFRNIFGRFFRTNKESYIEATNQVTTKEKVYQNNLINSSLLGLDLTFLKKKKELKIKSDRLKLLIKELKELQKNIDKEREFELIERLGEINKHLDSFEIAQDFNDLKNEADILTAKIQKIRNDIAYNNRLIRNKQMIIDTNHQVDIDISKLKNMYAEASFFLGEEVLNHIESVKEFHNTLFKNRKDRAKKDIELLKTDIANIEKELFVLDKRRSDIFKYLENKGALEEYHALNREKDSIKESLEQIQRDEKSLEKYKKEQADIKLEIDQFKRKLIDLESDLKDKIQFLGKSFREISEEFYNDKPGFLHIEIVEKFNTEKLYKIEPKIDNENSSDGINEMKIFIYDMLLYKLNPNLIGLVGHDNRLFDMVDERQIGYAFDYVHKNISQYICSVSDIKFNGAKEYSELNLDTFVRATLNETQKLFGFDFEK